MSSDGERIFEQCAEFFSYLAARWEDEKDYENWLDYQDAIRRSIEKLGGTYVGATHQPHLIVSYFAGTQCQVHVTDTEVKFLYLKRTGDES